MVLSQETQDRIQANWREVQSQVDAAIASSGRSDAVRIVGVTKYVGPELTSLLVQAGCELLGENRPQVIWEKHAWFEEQGLTQPQWDMIGHLQRNKARRTLPLIGWLHSVDSPRLVNTLQAEAERAGIVLPILIEVNVTSDQEKTGLQPDALPAILDQLGQCESLAPRGLMAMSSHFSGGDQARREFASVRELRDQYSQRYPDLELSELSMGMSGDFREAIAEGATLVRIGSSLWEGIERT